MSLGKCCGILEAKVTKDIDATSLRFGGKGVCVSPHFALARENQFVWLSLQCVATDLVWLIKGCPVRYLPAICERLRKLFIYKKILWSSIE